MTPVLFDLIIIALLLLSVALGFMRGFTNEVFTIFGWIGAVIATIYFTPVARPYGRELIHKAWMADLLTASVIFAVTLGIFSVVSYFATRSLHASKLGIVDRSLGFGFGILRAVVLFGLCFLLFSMAYADEKDRPKFMREARTTPFLEACAQWVQAIMPGDSADLKGKLKESGLDDVINPKDKDAKDKDDATIKDDLGDPPSGIDDNMKKLQDKAEELEKATGEKAEELTGDTLEEKIDNLTKKLDKPVKDKSDAE